MEMLSWEILDDYLEKGIPAQIPLSNGSDICFVIGQNRSSLALRLPSSCSASLAPSPYSELELQRTNLSGKSFIELSVVQRSLFRTFYNFSLEIGQLVLLKNIEVKQAIENSLSNWAQLLDQRNLLEETQQIGLIGELYFLGAMIKSLGADALHAWIGPLGEPHDFRFLSREIEVKSTTKSIRLHRIHGLGQLEPSTGMQLFLLSLQFEPAGKAGAGKSLVQEISTIRSLLSHYPNHLQTFEKHISKIGYRDSDELFYSKKLKFRTLPVIMQVDQGFPRLTRGIVDQCLPNGASSRIAYVEYEINVDGLGHAEGSPEYKMALPGISQMENEND